MRAAIAMFSGVCLSTAAKANGIISAWNGRPHRSQSTAYRARRSEEHTSELQSQSNLVCRLLLEKKNPRLAIGLELEVVAERRARLVRHEPGLGALSAHDTCRRCDEGGAPTVWRAANATVRAADA